MRTTIATALTLFVGLSSLGWAEGYSLLPQGEEAPAVERAQYTRDEPVSIEAVADWLFPRNGDVPPLKGDWANGLAEQYARENGATELVFWRDLSERIAFKNGRLFHRQEALSAVFEAMPQDFEQPIAEYLSRRLSQNSKPSIQVIEDHRAGRFQRGLNSLKALCWRAARSLNGGIRKAPIPNGNFQIIRRFMSR